MLGAAGFIGRHVAKKLAENGFRVIGLGHGSWSEDDWKKWGLSSWLNSDISVSALDSLDLRGIPQCMIHCGGSASVSFAYNAPLLDFQRSVQSTSEILEWARLRTESKCRVVLVSSAAVYGDQGDIDATENSVRAPISPYGFNKVLAENLCDSYSRFFDVPVAIVRLFSVYGEGLRKQLLWDALNKFKSYESNFFGTGHELRDWVHVEDVANLLILAGTKSRSIFEIYNGGFDIATTRQVLCLLANKYSQNARVEFDCRIHKGNPRRLTSDCSRAKILLGWKPINHLDEGLSRYVVWFKSIDL